MIGWNWVSFLLLFLLLPTSFFHFKKIMRGKASPSSSTNSHKHSCKILDPNVYEVLNFFWPKLFIFFGVLPHYLKLWAVVCCCAIMEGLHMMLEWKKKRRRTLSSSMVQKRSPGPDGSGVNWPTIPPILMWVHLGEHWAPILAPPGFNHKSYEHHLLLILQLIWPLSRDL